MSPLVVCTTPIWAGRGLLSIGLTGRGSSVYIHGMEKPKLGEPRTVDIDPKRDEEMRVLREAGWTLQRIAAAYGISKQRVSAILKRLAKK